MQFCRSEKMIRIRYALLQSVFNIKRYVRRLLCGVLACIILFSSVFGDYFAAKAYAAEVGAVVAVDLIAELAISGGIAAAIFRTAEIIQGEVSSGYGFGSDGLDGYALNVNGILTDKVNSGEITNQQAGTVKKLSGVPVEIICPIYGTYQFLCTNELCNKIRTENPATEAAVREIVNTYWSSVDILDQRTFEEIAADPRNWVTNIDQLNITGKAIVGQAVFDSFGEELSGPSASFFTTGLAATIHMANSSTSTLVYGAAQLNEAFDYLVLRIPDWHVTGSYATNDADCFVAYVYDPAYGDFKYRTAASQICNPRRGFDVTSVDYDSGIKSISITWERFQALWPGAALPGILDPTEVFPNWGDLVGIEATDAIDLLDWMYADDRFWNTDILDLAIDEIADAVDARVDTGEDAGAQDIPIGLPIDIPIEGEGDVAWPSDLTDEDFDDPPAYPRTDEWADTDVTFPPYDPTPVDPDPEEPDPDNPGSEEPGPRPELMLPVLGGLFPFCIPQDVYNTIRVFNSTAQEPVWDIPLNLTVANRQLTNTTLHIDLTEYGLDGFFSTLRAVQIVIFIVGLAVFTKQFIF